jgi:orotate phosphoribosyltransferase
MTHACYHPSIEEAPVSGAKARLCDLLASRAYREGSFSLSSGRQSDFYIDAKQITLDPEGINLVGEVVFNLLQRHRVDAVGGLTLGADPIATAVAAFSDRCGSPIPAFIVRKEAKAHGLRKWIEGPLPEKAARVAVVDDVLTSGGSAVRAVERVREAGCKVVVVIGLLDREEGARTAIEAVGCTFESVVTISELRELRRKTRANSKDATLISR